MLKGRIPLVIAVVLAGLAGLFFYFAVEGERAKARRGWTLVYVVTAARDVPEGTVLEMDMIQQSPIPEQFVTGSVVRPDSVNYVVGQKVMVPLQAGDPILWSHFESTRGAEMLSTMVQKQGRAITIAVDEIASVGGWVRPNDHVDIIGTFRDPDSRDLMTVTLLQNMIVLATGNITGSTNINLLSEGDRKYNNVSFLVLPEEAEILTLAAELGTLTLSLRNPEDMDLQERREGRTTLETLLTGERTQALEKIRRDTIQIIRGMSSGSSDVGSGGVE
ncbi:MAG: Flp pilus assembly protein CpaB [Myxococcota bacterium]